MKKRVISLLLVVCMAVSLTACGGNGNNSNTSTTDEDGKTEGTEEGTGDEVASGDGVSVTACIAPEPETIDPSLNSSVDGATYIQHTFEGLMKYQVVEGQLEPEVVPGQAAALPEISEDEMTYTFTLRDDIYWSDGQPVTADDFVYSWRRIVDPATASDYCYIIDMLENAQEIQAGKKDKTELGIRALDEKTIEIKLVSPCAFFLSLCTFSSLVPLREDLVEGNTQWTFDTNSYVGNGKYKIEEWAHDSSITMVKNDKYYNPDEVKTEKITWKLMDDHNAMLADFRSGSLDFINEAPVDETAALISEGTMKISPYLGIYGVVFNTEVEAFADPKVREAFSLAINRNFICEQITQRGEEPATAWVPSGITNYAGGDFREDGGEYYSVDPADYEANCEKAKALLAEAGYPDGEGFPVVTYLYNTNDGHQKIYEALENMWREVLGVQVTGSNQDWNVFLASRTNGDFELARHGWIADYNDAVNFLDMFTAAAIDGNNYPRWINADYDQLLKDALYEKDAAKRQEYLHKAEDLMMADHIAAPLYFYVEKYCLNERLTGESHTSLGYWFLWNLEAAQ